jgi:purine-nucleoside phosphorylase
MDVQLQQTIEFINKNINIQPRIAIILGSGLGSFADTLEHKKKLSSDTIPHYPISTVEGHHGYLVFGKWKGIPLLVVQGRTHYYEGYSMEKVTYVVRIIAALGIKTLIVTNAAGGVNPDFVPGDLMLITDQINNMFRNPLRGPLRFGGDRFPDMSDPYSKKYFELIEDVARKNQISLKRGVLYVSTGPSYETAAEVKMIAKLGGDAASMSTIPEVIVANQEKLEIIGISCITNHATGIGGSFLSHSEVTKTANFVQKKFFLLLSGIIERIGKY